MTKESWQRGFYRFFEVVLGPTFVCCGGLAMLLPAIVGGDRPMNDSGLLAPVGAVIVRDPHTHQFVLVDRATGERVSLRPDGHEIPIADPDRPIVPSRRGE